MPLYLRPLVDDPPPNPIPLAQAIFWLCVCVFLVGGITGWLMRAWVMR